MATAITTVTKTASVVKTTKGSEKNWSEMLSMNRRHDLQLPLDIAKYDNEFKRSYNLYQRQQNQTERAWAHKHETWYQDDLIFRNHLLKQLKPITRRFKNIDSLSLQDTEDRQQPQQQPDQISNLDEGEFISFKNTFKKELPPLPQIKRRSTIRHFQNFNNEEHHHPHIVISKLKCPKILHEYEPRLHSHHHGPFLDIAQRFLKRKPETIEKGVDHNGKQKQQTQYLKVLMENEQERTKLAAIKFTQRLQDEKNKENRSSGFDDYDDDDYY